MIYFDNNATTAIAPEVIDAMLPYLNDNFGNASSAHEVGRIARSAVEAAREQVSTFLGAKRSSEIAFTSGGTESDNWAILGALQLQSEKRHIVTTSVEHEAVRKLCDKLERDGYSVTRLAVDRGGMIDLDELRSSITEQTAVVSIMTANNETGVIFPIADAVKIVKENSSALFHTDAVNAAGKIAIDVSISSTDLLSISGHKFHAPKGIGALYIRDGINLAPTFVGGGQESGRRAGTEAVHQIVALGSAAELYSNQPATHQIQELRDRLENGILSTIECASVNGDRKNRLPNTTNISFENLNGEMIMHLLDQADICVSTGSACNDAGRVASVVLQAMDVPFSRSMGSIRFSLGRYNTEAEVDVVLEKLPAIIERLHALAA